MTAPLHVILALILLFGLPALCFCWLAEALKRAAHRSAAAPTPKRKGRDLTPEYDAVAAARLARIVAEQEADAERREPWLVDLTVSQRRFGRRSFLDDDELRRVRNRRRSR